MTSVGTLPSGLSARYPGERMSLFLKDIGRPSKATPISCSAMCTAIELDPGAKYRVSMLQYLGYEGALPLPLGEGWGEGLRSIVRLLPLTRIARRDPTSPYGRGEVE